MLKQFCIDNLSQAVGIIHNISSIRFLCLFSREIPIRFFSNIFTLYHNTPYISSGLLQFNTVAVKDGIYI